MQVESQFSPVKKYPASLGVPARHWVSAPLCSEARHNLWNRREHPMAGWWGCSQQTAGTEGTARAGAITLNSRPPPHTTHRRGVMYMTCYFLVVKKTRVLFCWLLYISECKDGHGWKILNQISSKTEILRSRRISFPD